MALADHRLGHRDERAPRPRQAARDADEAQPARDRHHHREAAADEAHGFLLTREGSQYGQHTPELRPMSLDVAQFSATNSLTGR